MSANRPKRPDWSINFPMTPWEDLLYQIYVRQSIRRSGGLPAGRLVPVEKSGGWNADMSVPGPGQRRCSCRPSGLPGPQQPRIRTSSVAGRIVAGRRRWTAP
jgi:hypothetical protein